ncbi:MAG: hypothetical protein ACLRNA_10370 [Gemmiger formicilis]|uniref:hypothetical protein n=1 Tax=Gemmiger formicilis TaxID=745368 RepID=UPI003A30713B
MMEQLGVSCTTSAPSMRPTWAYSWRHFRVPPMAEQVAKVAASEGNRRRQRTGGLNFQKMMENMKYAAAENLVSVRRSRKFSS